MKHEFINVGIVGHEAAKFTPQTEAIARELIRQLLEQPGARLISGGCHLGGIDIWAEEIAGQLDIPKIIHLPENQNWSTGYKPRNILIAEDSDIVHNIVVAKYPPVYNGMRFDFCYHCKTDQHIKSGGCWTAKYAQKLGKEAKWHVILDG